MSSHPPDHSPCPAIRWAVGIDNDRACALRKGREGEHRFTVKPRTGGSGWEDQ